MKYLLVLFISCSAWFHMSHDFHVSKCLVEYKSDKGEIQISMNIFIDDLELALKSMGVDSLYIGTEKESVDADDYMLKYLEQSFTIGINNTQQKAWQYIGKEISEDLTSIWCYMRIEANDEIVELSIKNSILLETYDDQKNITSVVGPLKKKSSFMSTRGDDQKTFSYK